jgi:hypothetical protein
VGDGKNILFWLDTWLSEYSLATLFWDLFAIRNEPSATVADVLVDHEIYLTFRQCINDLVMERRYEVRNFLLSISLSLGGKDSHIALRHLGHTLLDRFTKGLKMVVYGFHTLLQFGLSKSMGVFTFYCGYSLKTAS